MIRSRALLAVHTLAVVLGALLCTAHALAPSTKSVPLSAFNFGYLYILSSSAFDRHFLVSGHLFILNTFYMSSIRPVTGTLAIFSGSIK